MIDVLRLPSRSGVIAGNARHYVGEIRLADHRAYGIASKYRTDLGTVGVITFGTFTPAARPVWVAAEVVGVFDQSTGSVRVRIGTDDALFYLDENDSLKLKRVTDEDSWDSQYCSPLALASLDLWPEPTLRIVIGLVSTAGDQNPIIRGVNVIADFPTWEGAVAQGVRLVAALVAATRPVLIHDETLTTQRSEWKLGTPNVESGHELTSLDTIDIDGVIRTGTLIEGKVVLNGAPARAGQRVKIAVKYAPKTIVRRVADVRTIQQLPIFILDDLTRGGGMNGTMPSMHINGVEVRRRMIHLRIQVRGAAVRQADAFAMRAALQEKFGGTETLTLDSGRTLGAAMMDVVEVMGSGVESMPVATGTIQCPFEEFTGYKRVAAARRTSGNAVVIPTNTVTIEHSAEAGFDQVLDSDSYTACQG